MQNASSNYVQAASAAGGTWAEPRLRADWQDNGYGGDTSIDNLSRQLGSVIVKHHLDDGLPDSVTFISGIGVGELDAKLGPPPAYVTGGVPMRTAEYWSPFNASSPMYGLDRDIAPTTLDLGLVGAGGPEYVRVFTGQSLDVRVEGGKGTLIAASAARLKLARAVHPPAVRGDNLRSILGSAGLNASWPVSWTLAQCGLYVSPPPRDGCRYWVPFHGSAHPFIPASNPVVAFNATQPEPFWESMRSLPGDTNYRPWRPTWVDGPFLLAPDVEVTADEMRRVAAGRIAFGAGTDFFSKAGHAGRLEFYVRGDATNINANPAGSGTVFRIAALFSLAPSLIVASAGFQLGIGTDRRIYVRVNDGAGHDVTLTSTDTLPTDGAWHFVGAAYDLAAKKLWVRNFDGTVSSATHATLTTTGLPARDTWAWPEPTFVAYVPVAELQFTAGAQANVDNYPTWLNAIPFTPDVVMTALRGEMAALVETRPREAWEFLSALARTEMMTLRIDENDLVNVLGVGWWVEDAQQTVVEAVSTEVNAGAVDVNADPSKIRNSVEVSYSATDLDTFPSAIYQGSQIVTLMPGTTLIELAFTTPAVALEWAPMLLASDTSFSGTVVVSYLTINTLPDGVGTYITDSNLMVTSIVSWHPGGMVLSIVNNTSVICYLANDVNQPSIQIYGTAANVAQASEEDADASTVAVRGERFIPVSAPLIQNAEDARRLARRIKLALRNPVPVVEGLKEIGDARRQPGDLITFEDPYTTKASGQWRRQSITHRWQAESSQVKYEQESILRPALPVCVVGTGLVGHSLVGPRE